MDRQEMLEEKIKPYKPLPKGSKFAKANKDGQIPKDCIHFNWCGKHCWYGNNAYEDVACDCRVLKGEYCEKYKKGVDLL